MKLFRHVPLCLVLACTTGTPSSEEDGGGSMMTGQDASTVGVGDAGQDAGLDAGPAQDASTGDAAASAMDGGTPDAAPTPDAATTDAATADAAATDASVLDAGQPGDASSSADAASPPDAAMATDAATPDAADAGATPWVMPQRPTCSGSYQTPITVGNLGDPALVETSGVVASPSIPGLLWMHNDSGDNARVFGVGTNGAALGTLTLGATVEDAEDIAAGPCPGAVGPCLYVADTGNNTLNRTNQAILAVLEPALANAGPFGALTAAVTWTFPVVYPSGAPVDSEALAVTPDGQTLYLFEKINGGQSRLFEGDIPLQDGDSVMLRLLGTFQAPGVPVDHGRDITAVDLHPSGTRLVMRVYTGVYEYRFPAGQGIPAILGLTPSLVTLGPFTEQQGEAAAYDGEGTGLWTVSEDRMQQPGQPLHFYSCP